MSTRGNRDGSATGKWFISHNKANKSDARTLGAAMLAQQLDVWFDEWEIQPGDRIVHAINSGLDAASGMIVLWSKDANRSNWVDRELGAAIHRSVADPRFKVVPILLDETPLPSLIAEVCSVDWRSNRLAAIEAILRATGAADRANRRSVLSGLANLCDDLGVPMNGFWGIMICRNCGSEALDCYETSDDDHDRRYAGVRCKDCGWEEGTEI